MLHSNIHAHKEQVSTFSGVIIKPDVYLGRVKTSWSSQQGQLRVNPVTPRQTTKYKCDVFLDTNQHRRLTVFHCKGMQHKFRSEATRLTVTTWVKMLTVFICTGTKNAPSSMQEFSKKKIYSVKILF